MKIEIQQCSSVLRNFDAGQIGALLAQLSPGKTFASREVMYWTLDRNFVYVARDTNVVLDELDDDSTKIVGMATLVLVPKFAGLVAQIEDVCVDKEYRGKGIARLLMHAVMSTARERKVTHIDLTSSPSREAALALYESLQFERRETIPLRFTMGSAQ